MNEADDRVDASAPEARVEGTDALVRVRGT